jgi:hypothetical protein
MPLLDHDPIDPEIAAALDAIDATVAGEPVDARFADLAEIALLLASDTPRPVPAFAEVMDERIARRFAPAPAPAAGAARRRRLRWSGIWPTMTGIATAAALVVAIVFVASSSHGGSSASSSSAASLGSAASSSAANGSVAHGSPLPRLLSAPRPGASYGTATSAASAPSTAGSRASKAASSSAATSAAPSPPATSSGTPSPAPQPPTTGRKVVQSAQLNLTAAPSRIDAVAQELYDVVGQVNGIVNNSSVTQGGPNGYASFQLSVPSSSLGQTLTSLSELRYAQVSSRTDGTQDITNQYGAATSALADARALRTSLLKQLANADTTAEIDSITAQIHDAEASISSDQATLARLNRQINYSQVGVYINAQTPPIPVSHGGGFTLGRASHDAGRVLTVTAGGGLIAIAALLPVALVAALVWWVGSAVRRRRRDQALDLV